MKNLKRELLIAPLCEAGLLFAAGAVAWITHQPLFFASLGPTAYELTETPERASARPYSIVMGHLIGVVSGFAGLWLTGAWHVAPVSPHHIELLRVAAAMVASILTVLGTVLARATQPAALSTTLLVTTGAMQRPKDGVLIMASIVLITLIGEPVRRWRLRGRT